MVAVIPGSEKNTIPPLAVMEYSPISSPMTHSRTLSPLQNLAAKWRLIGLLAVAYARLMRRFEDGRVHGVQAQAEQLYLASRTAQVMLVQEVAETLKAHPPGSNADEDALAHLRGIMACLLILCLVIENMMARGNLLGPAIWQTAGFEAAADAAVPLGIFRDIPILDPG